MKSTESVPAPVAKGDHIADLIISVPGQDQQIYPLLAADDVKRKSAMGRAMGALVNIIRG